MRPKNLDQARDSGNNPPLPVVQVTAGHILKNLPCFFPIFTDDLQVRGFALIANLTLVTSSPKVSKLPEKIPILKVLRYVPLLFNQRRPYRPTKSLLLLSAIPGYVTSQTAEPLHYFFGHYFLEVYHPSVRRCRKTGPSRGLIRRTT